jgi:glycosyltransferase involved in cell wall biosynthesis
MKLQPHETNVTAHDPIHARVPLKVCMHVQGIVRTDARVMREATALIETGFAVTVVDIESESQRTPTEEIQGVYIKHVRMPSWYISTPFPLSLFKAFLMFIRTTIKLVGTSANVYHAHDVQALPASYIAARLRRKPLIFDAHELPLSEIPLSEMTINRRFIHPFLTRLFSAMIPYCSGVIATSSRMAFEICHRYSVPQVITVRNFPPYRRIHKSDRLHQLLGLSSDVRLALYQGNLQPDRQLDRLIRAAGFLEQNIIIVMMGKSYRSTQSELEALIVTENVSDRVKIIPAVAYADLLDWTASADIGLSILPVDYTSHLKVCLPNKLFEYLMAGLPVLASPLDAIAEVIRKYDVGWVLPSLEPAEVGAAINAMLRDQNALTRMSQNAFEAAWQDFNWEKESPQLVHLYHKILAMTHEKEEAESSNTNTALELSNNVDQQFMEDSIL